MSAGPVASKMKVLVVGGGGREHALAWALARSPSVASVACAPGNAGTATIARNHPVGAEDVSGIVALAKQHRFDLVVVGPEKPLSLGLADALSSEGIAVFGCSRAAAEIEGSKAFAKSLMVRANIPTARHQCFEDAAEAAAFAATLIAAGGDRGRAVVKADGLAGGKGVVICASEGEAAAATERLIAASGSVVVEEFLVGREASCMALVDGERVYMLPACEDHKTVFDGDRGPMTGGMGAICPTPAVDADLLSRIEREILIPAARALVEEGRLFRGVLYAGLMLTAEGPRVLEFNCRFGDPEAEALFARWKGDLAEALLAIAEGRAPEPGAIDFHPVASCTVVAAARGYPEGPVEKGAVITGLPAAAASATVFHGGTKRDGDRVLTDGGRVLAVTATGADAEAARDRAYRALSHIQFDGMHHRGDIGLRGAAKA